MAALRQKSADLGRRHAVHELHTRVSSVHEAPSRRAFRTKSARPALFIHHRGHLKKLMFLLPLSLSSRYPFFNFRQLTGGRAGRAVDAHREGRGYAHRVVGARGAVVVQDADARYLVITRWNIEDDRLLLNSFFKASWSSEKCSGSSWESFWRLLEGLWEVSGSRFLRNPLVFSASASRFCAQARVF